MRSVNWCYTVELGVEVSPSPKDRTLLWSSFAIPGHLAKGLYILQQGHVQILGHCCSGHNSQKMVSVYSTVDWLMANENVLSIHNRTYFVSYFHVYVCMHVWICVCTVMGGWVVARVWLSDHGHKCTHTCLWRPKTDVGVMSKCCLTIFFMSWSPTKPRAQRWTCLTLQLIETLSKL